jgi:transcriptional regulator with XRE-family HTH domain
MSETDSRSKRDLKNGVALQRARLAKGMTLGDVVRECALRGCTIDPRNLSRAERNMGGIGARKVPVLLEVLGLTVEVLVPGVDGKAA